MNFFIPQIGISIVLTAPWTFTLESHRSNFDLFKVIEPEKSKENKSKAAELRAKMRQMENEAKGGCMWGNQAYQLLSNEEYHLTSRYYNIKDYPTREHTFPVGTVLEVDSYDIIRGHPQSSSVFFRVRGGKTSPRFYAKLEDINKIQFDFPSKENPHVKWPNGRFRIGRSGNDERISLYWEASIDSKDRIHFTNWARTKDYKFETGGAHSSNSWFSASKATSYDSLEKLENAAIRFQLPADLVSEFKKAYRDKFPKPLRDVVEVGDEDY